MKAFSYHNIMSIQLQPLGTYFHCSALLHKRWLHFVLQVVNLL